MRNQTLILIVIFMLAITGLLADDDGLNNYKNKKYEEAKSYYEQVLAKKENNAAASLGLGASQYQLGDISTAAKSFEEALKSEDINIQDRAYYNLGNSLYSQQKMEESVAFYRKALELNPNDNDAKFNYELAKYLVQQQQEQNQDEQDQQQNDSKQDNDQENKPQDTDKEEPDKQEDEESDSSQEDERDTPKTQKQTNAEAILDALKDEEKIHQKVKMAQQSSRKFEKDW
jgi:Ca-activated chloride channel family protein